MDPITRGSFEETPLFRQVSKSFGRCDKGIMPTACNSVVTVTAACL